MTDFRDQPGAGPNERIGSTERDAAISALSVHRDAGRLDSVEFEDRQVAASKAQTWGELVPLFSDLPDPRPAKVTALAAYASPAGSVAPGRSGPGGVVPAGSSGGGLPERTRETIMALTPFAALILFFTTHTWLWFLAIPIMGILLYGAEGKPGRNRNRDRRRDH